MCRFLIAKSNQDLPTNQLIQAFAQMAEASRTVDGDRQGDGWGVAWIEDNVWKTYHNLKPMWSDYQSLPEIQSRWLVLHARSASFANQKGELEFNQPYIDGNLAFVFNGMIQKVSIPRLLAGRIGAQKIFSLFKYYYKKTGDLAQALAATHQEIVQYSQLIVGLNIGVVDTQTAVAVSDYTSSPEYFQLRYFNNDGLSLVCSEVLPGFDWQLANRAKLITI